MFVLHTWEHSTPPRHGRNPAVPRVETQDGTPQAPNPTPSREPPLPRAGPFICSENRPKMTGMSKSPEKPFFHVTLSDRDEWVVEAEWSDSTLERVSTFRDHSAAADWISSIRSMACRSTHPKDRHGA